LTHINLYSDEDHVRFKDAQAALEDILKGREKPEAYAFNPPLRSITFLNPFRLSNPAPIIER
jgi:hypothetical protein